MGQSNCKALLLLCLYCVSSARRRHTSGTHTTHGNSALLIWSKKKDRPRRLCATSSGGTPLSPSHSRAGILIGTSIWPWTSPRPWALARLRCSGHTRVPHAMASSAMGEQNKHIQTNILETRAVRRSPCARVCVSSCRVARTTSGDTCPIGWPST